MHALTCSIAGVREAVGREGLQRFMGEKSEVVTSRVGGLICRILGGLRAFAALRMHIVLLLLRDEELVSASMKLVSSPDKPIPLSICWRGEGLQSLHAFHSFTSNVFWVKIRGMCMHFRIIIHHNIYIIENDLHT